MESRGHAITMYHVLFFTNSNFKPNGNSKNNFFIFHFIKTTHIVVGWPCIVYMVAAGLYHKIPD